MNVTQVSASDWRVHFKDLANQVARGGAAVIVSRHGLELGAFINLDEYGEFLEWRSQRRGVRGAVEVPSDHPDAMPVEEVERVYRETAAATDDATLRWRSRAYLSLRARTGRSPDPPS